MHRAVPAARHGRGASSGRRAASATVLAGLAIAAAAAPAGAATRRFTTIDAEPRRPSASRDRHTNQARSRNEVRLARHHRPDSLTGASYVPSSGRLLASGPDATGVPSVGYTAPVFAYGATPAR